MASTATRVLFWTHDFGLRRGGGEIWASRYAASLLERGCDVQVLVAESDRSSEERSDARPIQWLNAGDALRNQDAKTFMAAIRRAEQLLEAFQPDVIHLSTGLTIPSLTLFLLTAARYRSRHNTPVIATLHCEWPEAFVHSGCLLEQALRHVDLLSCFSRDSLAWVRRHWPWMESRSVFLPHALPSREAAGPATPLPPPDRVAFAGRLMHDKGADLAIRAFARVREHFPELHFDIAGEGEDRPALEALARHLRVADAITFHGWVSEDEVARLMRASWLVLVPSRMEVFGLVVLEAAREGRPVVATCVGGLPEVCLHEQTGLLCAPEDPEALSEAVTRLFLNPDEAIRMGFAARAHFESFPGWEQHMDAFADLMQRSSTARAGSSTNVAPARSIR